MRRKNIIPCKVCRVIDINDGSLMLEDDKGQVGLVVGIIGS